MGRNTHTHTHIVWINRLGLLTLIVVSSTAKKIPVRACEYGLARRAVGRPVPPAYSFSTLRLNLGRYFASKSRIRCPRENYTDFTYISSNFSTDVYTITTTYYYPVHLLVSINSAPLFRHVESEHSQPSPSKTKQKTLIFREAEKSTCRSRWSGQFQESGSLIVDLWKVRFQEGSRKVVDTSGR